MVCGAKPSQAGLGRFLSRDPIGLAGGLNLFAYTSNDPARFVDPSGLQLPGDIPPRGGHVHPVDRPPSETRHPSPNFQAPVSTRTGRASAEAVLAAPESQAVLNHSKRVLNRLGCKDYDNMVISGRYGRWQAETNLATGSVALNPLQTTLASGSYEQRLAITVGALANERYHLQNRSDTAAGAEPRSDQYTVEVLTQWLIVTPGMSNEQVSAVESVITGYANRAQAGGMGETVDPRVYNTLGRPTLYYQDP